MEEMQNFVRILLQNLDVSIILPIFAPTKDKVMEEKRYPTVNLDWDKFSSISPFSDEEAIARIDRFEERLRKGEVKWTSSEQMWEELYNKHPWLR